MVLKQTVLSQSKRTKTHARGALSKQSMYLGLGTQYWTDLHDGIGIALKNNKLHVSIADIRHCGLVICILYTASGKGFLLTYLLQCMMAT